MRSEAQKKKKIVPDNPSRLTVYMPSPVGPLRISADNHGINEVHFLDKEVHFRDKEVHFRDQDEAELPMENFSRITGNQLSTDHDFESTDHNFDTLNQSAFEAFADKAVSAMAKECMRQLRDYFSGSLKKFDLPLAQDGTPFQARVWDELLNIGYGTTANYLTMAKRLGDPKLIRAAASANGKNHIAIIVPCHRVIGTSGELVGYAGGLHRKRWLLEHEQRFSHGLQTLF